MWISYIDVELNAEILLIFDEIMEIYFIIMLN